MVENQVTLPCIYDTPYREEPNELGKEKIKSKPAIWSHEKYYEILLIKQGRVAHHYKTCHEEIKISQVKSYAQKKNRSWKEWSGNGCLTGTFLIINQTINYAMA